MRRTIALCLLVLAAPAQSATATDATATDQHAAVEALIVQHASANGLPVALLRLVIRRESNFNPRAVYRGTVEGLLDPAINMTYGIPYLAGAYRAAHGDEARSLVLYSRGYHNVR